MPDMIRTAETARFSAQRQHSASPLAVATLLSIFVTLAILATPALAQSRDPLVRTIAHASTVHVAAIRSLDILELAGLTLIFGALIFAAMTAILLVRTRDRLRLERARGCAERAALDGEIDRLYALMQAEPQVIIAWGRGGAKPVIIGDPAAVTPEIAPNHLMSFATWLRSDHATLLQAA